MNEILLSVAKAIGVALLLLGIAPVLTITLAISLVLLVILFLQLLGVVKRVPYSYNLRNLRVRWHTTLLTALAFTLVVGLMTIMMAFVNGMYALTQGSSLPGNVMVLADGATDEVFSDLGYGDITQLETRPYVKHEKLQFEGKETDAALVSWELFQVVNQEIPNAGTGEGVRKRRFVQVRGIEDPVVSGFVHGLKLHDGGKWFDIGAGVQAVSGGGSEQYVQAVVGEGLAREMGPDFKKQALVPGDTFSLGPRKWVIVGVMKSGGKTFDSEVWAKRKLVGEMLRKDTRTTAVIRIQDDLDAAEVADKLTAEFKSPAVQARTEAAYFESLNSTSQTFYYGVLIIAVFMAVGGIFGVTNTMYAAIAQRTRDIGVLRLVGYQRWQIVSSFFLESLILAFLGGAIGCALGSLADGWAMTSQLSSGQGGGKSVMMKLVVDRNILLQCMLFSLIMGSIGGLLPALSAIRLKILDSLR